MGPHINAAAKLDPWTKSELSRWTKKLRTGKGWTTIDMKRVARIGVTCIYANENEDRLRTIMKMILRWEKAGVTTVAEIIRIMRARTGGRSQA